MNYIKNIQINGLFGKLDLNLEFQEGVNILHGKNGAGKTTLLHILTNILNGDYNRFSYLAFKEITISLGDNTVIKLNTLKVEKGTYILLKINNEETISIQVLQGKDNYVVQKGLQPQIINKEKKFDPIVPVAYFPAFRTMIEAWKSVKEEIPLQPLQPRRFSHGLGSFNPFNPDSESQQRTTRFARELFGEFIPDINYPSPKEIERNLTSKIQQALVNMAETDQKLITETLVNIFKSLSQKKTKSDLKPGEIFEKIKILNEDIEKASVQTQTTDISNIYSLLSEQIQSQTLNVEIASGILDVFRMTLETKSKAIKDAFEPIDKYLNAVNEFLDLKKLEKIAQNKGRYSSQLVGVVHEDETRTNLQSLSSGERQILTLIYAATYMNEQQVILIDEPEISLHVDWQRQLLSKMSAQLPNRQIIACTHSPVVVGDYEMQELNFTNSTVDIDKNKDIDEEELL